MKALRVLVLATVVAAVALAATGAGAAVGNECAGIQTCIDVPGPWVSIAPNGETKFLLDCPLRQGIVAGIDAKATSRDVHVTFDGLLGSPVAPGRTTSAIELFRAVTGHRKVGLFRPLIGCVPSSPSGGQTTAYEVTTPGPALDFAATEILLAPGTVRKATLGCANHESLVYSWNATAFATETPPSPDLATAVTVKSVTHGGVVAVTVTTSEAMPRAAKPLVQVGVACSK